MPHPVTAASAASPADCGDHTFLLRKGANDIGQERFTVECRPDGSVVVTARTEVRLPGENSTLDTVMETDSQLAARSLLVNGTSGGASVSQSIQIAGGSATFLAPPRSHTLPAPAGAAILPPDLVYPFALLAMRYDAAPNKSVPFSVPVLGGEPAHFEFAGTASYLHRVYYRLNLAMGDSTIVLWLDGDRRLAALYDPSQHLKAVREDLASEGTWLIGRIEARENDWEAPAGATYTAQEVSLPVSTWRLAGTLFLPRPGKRPAPAAILIPDAGEHDRNDSVPGMGDYQPFRQIAEDLAAHGIAVLRCDKRGAGQSTGLSTLEQATTADFAGDVSAQLAWLRARPEIDGTRIALVGHGEGGTIALSLAASDPALAAIVLMGAPGKRGDGIILDQTREELAGVADLTPSQRAAKLEEERTLLEAVLAGGDNVRLPPDARTPWFREFVRSDPAMQIRAVTQPTLILHGAVDKEIGSEQAGRLAAEEKAGGNKSVEVRLFPRLNHLFLEAESGAPSEYGELEALEMPPEVVTAVDLFLVKRLDPELPEGLRPIPLHRNPWDITAAIGGGVIFGPPGTNSANRGAITGSTLPIWLGVRWHQVAAPLPGPFLAGGMEYELYQNPWPTGATSGASRLVPELRGGLDLGSEKEGRKSLDQMAARLLVYAIVGYRIYNPQDAGGVRLGIGIGSPSAMVHSAGSIGYCLPIPLDLELVTDYSTTSRQTYQARLNWSF